MNDLRILKSLYLYKQEIQNEKVELLQDKLNR